MARARLLKPSLFTNEALSALVTSARLLFIGLWTIADREGRLEDRPSRIKVELLPYDRVKIDALLQQLHTAGFIVRYESGGNKYIQIVNFTKHQHVHQQEPASTIPSPDKPSKNRGKPDQFGSDPAEALTLNPLTEAEALERKQGNSQDPPARTRGQGKEGEEPNAERQQSAEGPFAKYGRPADDDAGAP